MQIVEVNGVTVAVTMTLTVNNLLATEPKRDRLLTAAQAAGYIGVHVETLRKWVRTAKIPRVSLPGKGNDVRFSKSQLDKWIADRSLKGPLEVSRDRGCPKIALKIKSLPLKSA
jgi:excisionase family DNA binding protein